MSSSTSSSDVAARTAIVLMIATLLVCIVPYELAVRASERRHGKRIANIAHPRSADPKLEAFLREIDSGSNPNIYFIGNSLCENGLRPSVIETAFGARAYNLGVGGMPPMHALQLLDRVGERPQIVLLAVAPHDFTDLGNRLGTKMLNRFSALIEARQPASNAVTPQTVIEKTTRAAVLSVLRSGAIERRRTLADWYRFFAEGRTDPVAFLNNSDAGDSRPGAYERGYVGVYATANPDSWTNPFAGASAEYAKRSQTYLPLLEEEILELSRRGTRIIVVRLPISRHARDHEDSATSFDADIRALCTRTGVQYVDGQELVSRDFAADARNFVDQTHLNVDGGTAFSDALRAHLVRRGQAGEKYAIPGGRR